MFNGSNTLALNDDDPLLMERGRYLREKALYLRIVEEFLTQIELSLLKTDGDPFDLDPIRLSINNLRGLASDVNPDLRKEAEFHLAQELLGWQENLRSRDEKIEAYHIRRYCDGLRKPLATEVFLSLARFYRDIPRCKNSQSKFDLALTRSFSTSVSDLHRSMSMSREDIAARLAALYCSWDRVISVEAGSQQDVSGFDKFLAESDSMLDFRSLTDSRVFDRIREFKAELGDRFWDPEVAAAAVECNVVVGNHFNGLMARASENLGERLGSEFDVAGAFQDTSSNTGTYIAEVLREIDEETPILIDESRAESDDIRFLRSLLQLSDSINDGSEADGAADEPAMETLSTDRPEFRAMISTLEQHNPDTRPIIEFVAATDLGSKFQVDTFLFREDRQPDLIGRQALCLILSLESYRKYELRYPRMLPVVVKNRVMSVLSQAAELGSKIDAAINDQPEAECRYLRIANRLLEARLRAERSIVKFTSLGIGAVAIKTSDELPAAANESEVHREPIAS